MVLFTLSLSLVAWLIVSALAPQTGVMAPVAWATWVSTQALFTAQAVNIQKTPSLRGNHLVAFLAVFWQAATALVVQLLLLWLSRGQWASFSWLLATSAMLLIWTKIYQIVTRPDLRPLNPQIYREKRIAPYWQALIGIGVGSLIASLNEVWPQDSQLPVFLVTLVSHLAFEWYTIWLPHMTTQESINFGVLPELMLATLRPIAYLALATVLANTTGAYGLYLFWPITTGGAMAFETILRREL